MRDDRERLLDILEAIERIEKYAARGRDGYERDELVQNWIVHHLEIIGEATRSLSETLRNRHPEVDWAEPIGMRNVLAHHYFDIDLDQVWSVVISDLPIFRSTIEAILAEMQ